MSDPRRLIDGSSSRLVTGLLAAGRLEEPAPELVERFLQTAPLGLTAGVVVERLISTTVELGVSQSAATGSAAGTAVAAPATAGTTAAGANLVAGSTATSVVSVGGASGVTSAGLVHGGAVAVGLMKGSAAGAALVKSGTAAAVLAKWVGLGVIGLAAAAGTPKLLHWVDHRNSGTAASTAARLEATPVSPVAMPRSSMPSAAPRFEPTEAAQLAEPARVVDPGVAPRGEPLALPAGVERTPLPNRRVDSKSRQAPPAASIASPPPRSRVDSKSRQVSPAASPPSPSPHSRVVPTPAREKPPSMVASPAPSWLDSDTGLAPIAAPPRTLSFELASVDRARAALARGDARQTLHELAGHERRYPKGQLELEVSVLRMEAHVQRGDLPAARELARRILAGRVSPLHARRARQILEGQF